MSAIRIIDFFVSSKYLRMLYFLLLLAGFLPLIYGANLLVDNASSLAKRLNIPNIVIGLTIVGFGTSAPEMVVNIFASFGKSSGLVLGNIIGSNLFNTLVILGISTLIYPIMVKKNTIWTEIPLSLLAAVVVALMANDILIDGAGSSVITRTEGFILLLFFAIFLAYNIHLTLSEGYTGEVEVHDKPVPRALILLFAGLFLLILGGRVIVFSAIKVASMIGLTERVIALTVVSVGTSLPELATSVIAARKKNTEIAIGNVIGSNIYNIFFILGLSAVINPVAVQSMANLDLILNVAVSLLLFIFVFTGKKRKLHRMEGIIFLIIYIVYVTYLIIN